jgi:hypothetical protein
MKPTTTTSTTINPTTTTTTPGHCDGDGDGDHGHGHGHHDDGHGHGHDGYGHDEHGTGGDGNAFGHFFFTRSVSQHSDGHGDDHHPCPPPPPPPCVQGPGHGGPPGHSVICLDHGRGDCGPFSDRVVTIHARTISTHMPAHRSGALGGVVLVLAGLALSATSVGWAARRRLF